MKKINILFCIPYLAHGGTEKQLMTLIKGLNRSIFVPHLCCIKKSMIEPTFVKDALSLFRDMKCQKIQLDFKSFRNISSIFSILKLSRYIRRNRIDIVVSYFIDPTIISFFSSKLSLRKPIIVTCFRDLGLLRPTQNRTLMKLIYNNIPHFLANSRPVKENYIKFDSIASNKISVIYNGVDTEWFKKIERPSEKPTVVGLVANLNRPVKRVDVFLKAASYVCQMTNGVSFMIVGEGALKQDFISLASELGLEKRVKFVGRAYKLEECSSQIHIGVNTSETEGFSNVILEYLASGIPVLATDTGGNREIIVNNHNGFLFPVNDYKAMANKLMLILKNEKLYSELKENCRKSVENKFENSIMIKNYETFFRQIVNNSLQEQ